MAEAQLIATPVVASEGTNATSHGPLTLPTVTNDDVAIFALVVASGTVVTATGAGMSAEAAVSINSRSGFALHVWVKKLTAAMSGTTVQFSTVSTLKTAALGWIARGIDPNVAAVIPTPVNGTSTPAMAPSAFTPAANKVLVQVIGIATAAVAPPDPATGWTPPTGMTKDVAQGMGGTSGRAGLALASIKSDNVGFSGTWASSPNGSWGITSIELTLKAATPPEPEPDVIAYVREVVANFDWKETAVADALTTDIPTRSTAVNSGSTISGATLVAPNDSRFRYRGGDGFAYGSSFPDTVCYQPNSRYPNGWGNPATFAVEFDVTTNELEWRFKWLSAAGAGWARISIDGKRLTDLMEDIPGITGGSLHVQKLTWATTAKRRILIEFQGVPFGGIYLPPGAVLEQTPPWDLRILAQGDSMTAGSDGNAGNAAGTWFARLINYMNERVDGWNQAIGATGMTAPGSSVTIPNRLADVTTKNPDVVILWFGGNDGSTSVVTETTQWVNDVKAAVPDAEVILVGTWSPTVSPSAARAGRSADIKAAALATGCPFIEPQSGQVYNGEGNLIASQGPWIATSGDVSAYVYTGDNVHATDAGHDMIAKRMYQALNAVNEIELVPYLKTSGGEQLLELGIN